MRAWLNSRLSVLICKGKERGCSILLVYLRKLESVYTKWSYSGCVQVERNCYFFSPSHISWLVRFINVGVNIQWELALNITAGSLAAVMLYPASSTRFLLWLWRHFIYFKPLLNPYDSVCYCSYRCPILFQGLLIFWFQAYALTVQQSVIALRLFPFTILDLLSLGSTGDTNDGE